MKSKPFPRLQTIALIAILALPILPSAFAQVAPAAPRDEAVKLEAFTVVGSNIRRLDVEKVLPVTVFDTAAIEVRDAAQPSDLLTALPQVTGLPGNETVRQYAVGSCRGGAAVEGVHNVKQGALCDPLLRQVL